MYAGPHPRARALATASVGALLVLTSCDPMGAVCDGRAPGDGEEVAIQLFVLGYSTFSTDLVDEGFDEIIATEDRWNAVVSSMGTDGGAAPDFDTEVVFVSVWHEGGCDDEAPSYGAWRWDDVLRVRRVDGDPCDNDMALPNADIGVIDRGSATDFGWCE